MAMTLTQDDIDAIAAAILVTPANKLVTNASGYAGLDFDNRTDTNGILPGLTAQEARDAMKLAPGALVAAA